jgi:hypothetical protein
MGISKRQQDMRAVRGHMWSPWSAVDRATRGSGPVLGGDRSRGFKRGCSGRDWRVTGGRGEVVPASWWDVTHGNTTICIIVPVSSY